jgi:hypothetical protein
LKAPVGDTVSSSILSLTQSAVGAEWERENACERTPIDVDAGCTNLPRNSAAGLLAKALACWAELRDLARLRCDLLALLEVLELD